MPSLRHVSFRYALLFLLSLSLTGCTALTHLHRPADASNEATATALLDDGYHDYVGVIHVHTRYSHDASGTFEKAVRVANAQRLDYLLITEHNTLRPLQEGLQGWHGGVLVLIGTEISTRAGHYLAFNITQEIDRSRRTTQQIIDEANRQGGFGFIAHPYYKRRRWNDWNVTGFTGLEIYNVAHDTLDENWRRLALWTIMAPAESFYDSIIDRPYDPLAKWDALIRQRGKIVGIGGSDAHEIHLFGLKFAPYEIMFQMVRTHLLIPSGTLTPELVYVALRQGHAYVAIELLGNAKGFSFTADDGQHLLGIMGDEVRFTPRVRLNVTLPDSAEMTLFHNGRSIQTASGSTWHIPVTQPGAYRIEVTRQGKPWIFSNPIYILPSTTPSSPS